MSFVIVQRVESKLVLYIASEVLMILKYKREILYANVCSVRTRALKNIWFLREAEILDQTQKNTSLWRTQTLKATSTLEDFD